MITVVVVVLRQRAVCVIVLSFLVFQNMSTFESELENLLGEFHIKMKGKTYTYIIYFIYIYIYTLLFTNV